MILPTQSRILVTGHAGFVGFHLVRRLLAEGHAVTGFDAMTPYYDVTLKQARLDRLEGSENYTSVIGRLEDDGDLERAAELARPDVIFHLAAQAGVRYALENPRAYVDSNLLGSWRVLDVARQAKPRHLLLASSSSVYGMNAKVPFVETDSTDQPLSFYAATKKAMEVMAHAHAHLHRVPTTVFRFFTVYGPWGRPDMALFKFTDAILRNQPIDVYGAGHMQRDFTFVDDLIEAVLRLMPLAPGPASHTAVPFRVINIGGGQPVGLLDFIETLEAELGLTALRNLLPMQPGDVPRTFASPVLLEQLTGYRPSTPLSAGVKAFADWYRDYYNLK